MQKHSNHRAPRNQFLHQFESLNEQDMLNVIKIFQALSDLTRARVIYALTQGERSVNDLAVAVSASPSDVSHHLRRLRDAGLVTFHRHGNQVFYSIEDAHIAAILEEALNHIDHAYAERIHHAKPKRKRTSPSP